jgi:hypothetical protein
MYTYIYIYIDTHTHTHTHTIYIYTYHTYTHTHTGEEFDSDEMEKIRGKKNLSSYGDSDDSLEKYAKVVDPAKGVFYFLF